MAPRHSTPPMPQLTLFGGHAKPAAPARATNKPRPSKQTAAPKPAGVDLQAAAPARATNKPRPSKQTAAPKPAGVDLQAASASLDDAAKAQAIWAQLRSSQASGISAPASSSANHLSTLERMRGQEQLLVEQHVAAGIARPTTVDRSKVPTTQEAPHAGWRRMRDGERAFVTSSGKRLTGKVAHAAAKRLKS